MRSRLRTQQVPIRVSVRHGSSVTGEILAAASAGAADLIVRGAAPHRGRLCFSRPVQDIHSQAKSAIAAAVTPDRDGRLMPQRPVSIVAERFQKWPVALPDPAHLM
jgi:hypothetical protein